MNHVVRIGAATLYLGDALAVLPTLHRVEAVITDPPYGNANHDGDWNARLNAHRGIADQPIANDDMASMRRLLDAALREVARLLPKEVSACCCFCGGGGPRPTFAWLAERMDREGLEFFHSLVWDKRNPGLGQRYRRQHEMILVAHRHGGRIRWSETMRPQPNVWSVMPPRDRAHPNEKPLALLRRLVETHSLPDDRVLDPFMGSGTTGMACLAAGRRFVGVEIEPRYFEIACRRIERAQREAADAARQINLFAAPSAPPREA